MKDNTSHHPSPARKHLETAELREIAMTCPRRFSFNYTEVPLPAQHADTPSGRALKCAASVRTYTNTAAIPPKPSAQTTINDAADLVLGRLLGAAASLLDDTVLDTLLPGKGDDGSGLGADDEHVGPTGGPRLASLVLDMHDIVRPLVPLRALQSTQQSHTIRHQSRTSPPLKAEHPKTENTETTTKQRVECPQTRTRKRRVHGKRCGSQECTRAAFRNTHTVCQCLALLAFAHTCRHYPLP